MADAAGPRRAFFLDRDGIVNRRRIDDYVKDPSEFDFIEDIFSVLPLMRAAGGLVVLITNQRGIGRGLMTEEGLAAIHDAMQRELLRRTGSRFDAIYHCPHDHADECDCRKPLPGMLLRAAAEHGIDLAASWMIGDSESDILAGIAAGCHTAKVDPLLAKSRAEILTATLREAWERMEHAMMTAGQSTPDLSN
ncbi:MAG: D,D-heptose 1,7-bisphosphate phosphatase [Chlorobi bacterium]|nr:D,D-heptose 1,7-bisphosphate phosphatase [Chlorobiota bacterium]